jgi:hypothetical protein
MKKDTLPRFPWLHRHNVAPIPSNPEHTPPIPPIIADHDQLVESLNIFKGRSDLAAPQAEQLESIIAEDAKRLASHIVPPEVAQELALKNSVNEIFPPSIDDAYLLAYALDATGDAVVHDALGYILQYDTPTFGDTLKMAYETSEVSGNPVMVEERRLGEPEDLRIDPYIQDWINAANMAEEYGNTYSIPK